jgi:hypothetical protein
MIFCKKRQRNGQVERKREWRGSLSKLVLLPGNRLLALLWSQVLKGVGMVPILNFALGANFDPQGWILSLGDEVSTWNSLFAPPFFWECSPLGMNKGVNIPPRGRMSPLRAKFTPRGKLQPWGQTMLLKRAQDLKPGVIFHVMLQCRF